MLSELRIRNFALIDRLTVRLGPGLNVLTGETGAGKSIIVGALSLLLGERASADVVRAGEDRASVEGVFDVAGRADVAAILDERGIDPDDDGLLVLKREVAVEGRNRAWVNGSPTTAAVLGELGRALVDLHGQHEHQTLLKRDEQRAILDAYAGNAAELARVREAHRDGVRACAARSRRWTTRRREAAQRADFLRFQADEIESAALRPGEEEELEDEARRLSHSEELQALSGGLSDAVTGSDRALLGEVGGLRRPIDQLVRIDPAQEERARAVRDGVLRAAGAGGADGALRRHHRARPAAPGRDPPPAGPGLSPQGQVRPDAGRGPGGRPQGARGAGPDRQRGVGAGRAAQAAGRGRGGAGRRRRRAHGHARGRHGAAVGRGRRPCCRSWG